MKALGEFLRKYLRGTFEPYFIVSEESSPNNSIKLSITESMISDMCLRGSFNPSKIRIYMSKELSTTNISLCLQTEPYPLSADSNLPISGFPRELVSEDNKIQGI